MLSYQEDTQGVLLHEGITEAGSVASWTAAGTSYATHGEPMIPVYIFYSMFGFQRTGDGLWAAADQMTRGFLLGATAGRTTLNGEGLQHQDGHSPVAGVDATRRHATTTPRTRSRPATSSGDGLRRMYGDPGGEENVFYYLTVYNEPIVQPAQPDDVDVDGILAGMHLYSPADTRCRTESADPSFRHCHAVGPGGTTPPAARLGRACWRVVGDLLDAVAPGRPGRG